MSQTTRLKSSRNKQSIIRHDISITYSLDWLQYFSPQIDSIQSPEQQIHHSLTCPYRLKSQRQPCLANKALCIPGRIFLTVEAMGISNRNAARQVMFAIETYNTNNRNSVENFTDWAPAHAFLCRTVAIEFCDPRRP